MYSNPPIELSPQLQVTLFRVRERVLEALERIDGPMEPTDPNTRIALIMQLRKWFPDSVERDLRISLLQILTGIRDIESQNELPYTISKILLEVTDDSSTYLTKELSAELQEAITSCAFGEAVLLPIASPESLAVPDLF